MSRCDPRADAQVYPYELPIWADRERARYGSWYEIFVRSQGTAPNRSATFREAEQRSKDHIEEMNRWFSSLMAETYG